jgi:tRNA (cytidine32/uridine32-2'-O)-methyltransferase
MYSNVRIVLVNTSHPGNIGSAARAMKTMGLTNLVLAAPLLYPHPKAQEMASNAGDILEQAVVVSSFEEAIKDCQMVIGTSARDRAIPWPNLNPREAAEKVFADCRDQQVAIVFGREHSGLTNEELHQCHYHLHIPANPEYSSLNLASAVQVIGYELRMTHLAGESTAQSKKPVWDNALASSEEVNLFYEHLEHVLVEIDFLKPSAPRQLMARLKRLYNRVHLDKMEVNILRGILTAVEKK